MLPMPGYTAIRNRQAGDCDVQPARDFEDAEGRRPWGGAALHTQQVRTWSEDAQVLADDEGRAGELDAATHVRGEGDAMARRCLRDDISQRTLAGVTFGSDKQIDRFRRADVAPVS